MRCFAAWTLWFLGQPDKALALIEEALTLARELSEPHALAPAMFFAAILHQLRREEKMAHERAEAAIAVSSEHDLVLYQAMAMIIRGWAMNEQGWHEDAIEQMLQGLADHEATGAEVLRPHFLGLLAETLGNAGKPDDGLRLLDEALEVSHSYGEAYYQAELYRIKGDVLLMQAAGPGLSLGSSGRKPAVQHAQAQACFHQAIEIARRQKAKSWELRAAMRLARLCQNQGEKQEALDLLSNIYGSFTEGFDTLDLREAKALLNELL